jgi:Cu(I)/Ag(I) efflux system periplasmic protein CusF
MQRNKAAQSDGASAASIARRFQTKKLDVTQAFLPCHRKPAFPRYITMDFKKDLIMKNFTIALLSALAVSSAMAQTAPANATAPAPAATPAAQANTKDMAEAEVRKIDKDAKKVTLKHGPIKNLDMPGMTMVFQVRDAALFDKIAVGDKIIFAAEKMQGAYVVTAVEKVETK